MVVHIAKEMRKLVCIADSSLPLKTFHHFQNQKVVWLRQEQKKAAKKTASPNIWPISTSAVQPLGYRKEAQAHVNLPEIR